MAPPPDVGEAITTAELLGALPEGVPLSGRVDLAGRGLVEQAAEADEVLLRGRSLGPIHTLPLGRELGGGHEREYGSVRVARIAGALIAAVPTLLVYILPGRYFVRGLLAGSLMG